MVMDKLRILKRHTVYPSNGAMALAGGKPVVSWCTPEPNHIPLAPTNSNMETKTQLREDPRRTQERELYPRKVRLFSPSPPPPYRATDETHNSPLRADKVKISKESDSTKQRTPPTNLEEAPVLETPDSPVPSSPSRENRSWCKGLFNVPAFCDPFSSIDPQGCVYISWLLVMTFCYSYNAWCIPLRATFPYQRADNTPQWMVADYLCDLMYLLDVALVKPRLMYLHEGFWVSNPSDTRNNYRKKLQYKFDVVSMIPLDVFYLYYGTHAVLLRLPRLLKLQTFWEFHQAMDRVLSSPYLVRIGKTLFYIFYLIHLNACAYYAMSVYEGLGSNGWVYDDEGNAYIRCFYFATKTATSIGKNPKPENELEYLFMTAAWLMGVFVFALLIGQIRDIIATATRAQAEYCKMVDGCTRYLRRLNMPLSLQRRVTAWFTFTWNQQRCFDESRILNWLPSNMKRDVALAVHMSTLSKVQLFRDCSASLLRDLVLQLRPVSFLPGDVVVRRGDVGHLMYIIKSGECYVLSPDEREVLATLQEGCVFGEISLLAIDGARRRTATVRSRGYSNLFALSKSDLDHALMHHREAAHLLRRRADQIILENATRQAERRAAERQAAKRSATVHEDAASITRRPSSISNSSGGHTEARKKLRCTSAQSKRKLSSVSENKMLDSSSLVAECSRVRTPLPTIVFSAE